MVMYMKIDYFMAKLATLVEKYPRTPESRDNEMSR